MRHGLLYTQFKYLSTFKTNDIQLQPTAANSTEPHVNNTETKSTSGNEIPICNEAIFRSLRNSRLQLTQFEPEIMPDIWKNLIPVETPRILDEQVLAGTYGAYPHFSSKLIFTVVYFVLLAVPQVIFLCSDIIIQNYSTA